MTKAKLARLKAYYDGMAGRTIANSDMVRVDITELIEALEQARQELEDLKRQHKDCLEQKESLRGGKHDRS